MRERRDCRGVRVSWGVILAVVILAALALTVTAGADTGHEHQWTYSVENNFSSATIHASCACSATGQAVLSAPSASDQVYDGTEKMAMLSGSIEGVDLSSLSISYTGKVTGGHPVNAGHYVASVAFGNETANVAFDIAPKEEMSAIFLDMDSMFVYTGSEIIPDVTVYDGAIVLERGVDYTLSLSKNIHAGTAEIHVFFANNYSGHKEGTFTILPQSVTSPRVVLEYDETVYDGQAKTPSVVVYNDAGSLIPAEAYEVVYSDNVYAGTASVSITNVVNGDYSINYGDTFTINQRTLTVDVADHTIIRGHAVPTFTCEINGLAAGDALVAQPQLSCTADGKTPGNYDISVSNTLAVTRGGTDVTDNYDIDIQTGTLMVLERVDVTTLGTVTAPSDLRYTGGVFPQFVTVDLVFGSYTLQEGVDYELEYRHVDEGVHDGFLEVGEYVVTVTGMGDYQGQIMELFTVDRGIPTGYTVPSGITATYGDRLSSIALPSDSEGEWQWKNGNATVGNAGQGLHVATYVPNDTKHWSPVDVAVSIAVEKALPQYTTPTDLEAEYGDTLADVTLPAGFSWMAPESTVVGEVGEHDFYVVYTPDDTDNYFPVGYIEVTVRVTREINASDVWVDGTLIYNGSAQSPTVTVTSDVTYLITGNTAVDAGSYELTVYGTGYYTGSVTCDWSIGKATPVYATPAGLSAVYGDRLESVSLPDGFHWQGDTSASVGAAGVNVFYVTYVPEDPRNYETVTDIAVSVQVSRASASFIAPTANWLTYDGTEQALIEGGVAVGGTLLYSLNEDGPFTAHIPTAKDAGEYTVWYKVEGDENHMDSGVSSLSVTIDTYMLTDADVQVEREVPYNGSIQSPKITIDPDVTYDITGHRASEVGSYVLILTGTGNYSGQISRNWAITKADPTYTVPAKITAYFGDTLGDVKLPEGFSWQLPDDTSVGAVGSYAFLLTYTPSSTDNYNTITDIPVILSVEPKPISDVTVTLVGGLIYNGERQTQEFVISPVGGHEVTYIVLGNKATDVGIYTMTLTGTGNFTGSTDITYTIAPNTEKIDPLTPANVKSSHKDDIEEVKDSIRGTEAKEKWADVIAKCDELLARIAAVEKAIEEIKAIVDGVDEDAVSMGDKEKLQYADLAAKELLSTDNLTEAQRAELEALREKAKELLADAEKKEASIRALENLLAKYQLETVKSSDRIDIENILRNVKELLDNAPSGSEEQRLLTQMTEFGNSLIARIEEAHAAVNTDAVTAAKVITAANATLQDKDKLEKACADLESALAKYSGNYTDGEKTAIEAELARIKALLEVLINAGRVQDMIDALPGADKVTPDLEDANNSYEEAKDAYDKLTDAEKNYVDSSRLDSLLTALTDYRILEGNDGIWKHGSKKPLEFKTNGLTKKLTGITVDGAPLTADDYTATAEGGISIAASYLKTLKKGDHSISILYTDGEADGQFTVKASLLWLWILLILLLLLLA